MNRWTRTAPGRAHDRARTLCFNNFEAGGLARTRPNPIQKD